jgi:tRNA(Ile)-lysidine synthase
MASSRKRPSDDPAAAVARFVRAHRLEGTSLAVGFSGGVDSTVLLHALKGLETRCRLRVSAVHVHHGLSPDADLWRKSCARTCREMGVPFRSYRVTVQRRGKGVEAAARAARYGVYRAVRADALALAHQLDDQAETVLMNLLRGAGLAGARGMPAAARLGAKRLVRPLLEVRREAILSYARAHGLAWIEDPSNRDERLARGFLRERVAPALDQRFPRWRESLARAARHFAGAEADAQRLLRAFLACRGLRAPSEAKLVEMLRQLTSGGARTLVEHEGVRMRVYRGRLSAAPARGEPRFTPVSWKGERRLPVPALGGELRFASARGRGIDADQAARPGFMVRLRAGGERLQPDAGRPRRTLKNLFQEAGVPPWERDRLPLLYRGDELVWVPGIGVDARFQAPPDAPGLVPEWRRD